MIKDTLQNIVIVPIVIIVLITLPAVILILWVFNYVYGLFLNYIFRIKWASSNKNILFVYSASPNWQKYIDNNIAPVIKEKTVFLDWSKRSEWKKKKPLEAKILSHWGGDFEFCPMAIIFEGGGKIKIIRFHRAFIEYKHGKEVLLKNKETELYCYV